MRHSELVKLRSGLEISAFSLGTAAFGGLFKPVENAECGSTISHALKAGIKLIDTAPHYGKGVAEKRLGQALHGIDESSYVLSTKVGRLLRPIDYEADESFLDADTSVTRVFDFSYSGVMQSFEESLERLNVNSIDILFIHDPDDHEQQAIAEAFPALAELRSKGLIKAIGVGMNQSKIPTSFVEQTDIDMVLIAGRYSLLDQSADHDLLPAAVRRGVDVIAAGVFNSGVLADPESPDATYNYLPVTPELRQRAIRIRDLILQHGYSLTSIAMQFPLRHRAIKSVLVGCRSTAELIENISNFNQEVEESFWQSLVSEL